MLLFRSSISHQEWTPYDLPLLKVALRPPCSSRLASTAICHAGAHQSRDFPVWSSVVVQKLDETNHGFIGHSYDAASCFSQLDLFFFPKLCQKENTEWSFIVRYAVTLGLMMTLTHIRLWSWDRRTRSQTGAGAIKHKENVCTVPHLENTRYVPLTVSSTLCSVLKCSILPIVLAPRCFRRKEAVFWMSGYHKIQAVLPEHSKRPWFICLTFLLFFSP